MLFPYLKCRDSNKNRKQFISISKHPQSCIRLALNCQISPVVLWWKVNIEWHRCCEENATIRCSSKIQYMYITSKPVLPQLIWVMGHQPITLKLINLPPLEHVIIEGLNGHMNSRPDIVQSLFVQPRICSGPSWTETHSDHSPFDHIIFSSLENNIHIIIYILYIYIDSVSVY